MTNTTNHVKLIGILGHDPEIREIAKGRKVARMIVMTRDEFIDPQTQDKLVDTQWHTVVAWGRTAEQVEMLLRKGSAITLEGRLVHRTYDRPFHPGVKVDVTEIVMSEFRLIQPKQAPIT